MSRTALNRFRGIKNGLFWRTFFLLVFLIMISMASWMASFRFLERKPHANQISAQVISIVTLTRAALTHSAPELRRELLFDLASNEGVRIYPLEKTDRTGPLPDNNLTPIIQANVRASLGNNTQLVGSVNGIAGFWVSFDIEGDAYWLMLRRERLDRSLSMQWLGWAIVTFILSSLGAVFISRLINQPLARLAAAAQALAKGQRPAPLPESGPNEIKETNRSFNQMIEDLERIESDRALVLAGISHDLRTPLARMQLEVALADLSDSAREGMQSDLAQMDAIIGQFLDYARPSNRAKFAPIDLSALLEDIVREASRAPDLHITSDIADHVAMLGNATDIGRAINNLIENARRYAKREQEKITRLDLSCKIADNQIVINIADHGPGILEIEIERLLRPFTRLDSARGQANGAGLGLAIVEKITKQHGGQFKLRNQQFNNQEFNNHPCGLVCTLIFPSAFSS